VTRTSGNPARAGTQAAGAGRHSEGWHGWDDYAAFYDWENARTVGRRDVPFWHEFAALARGPVLELGCGTGRVTLPLARAGVPIVGVDRSAEMLAFARRRLRRAGLLAQRPRPLGHLPALVRGDIRTLPFADAAFGAVIAPYGILQSLLRDRDLAAALDAVAQILRPGGRFAVDLVPDVPRWKEYRRRVSLVGRRGRKGPLVTLVESVRQDRARRLTIFDHEYIVGWGRTREVRRFTVCFRTLPVAAMIRRLERAGFRVEATLGDYDGHPLEQESGTWLIVAARR
jgi:SAM-dependent methyltransferase